MTLIYTLALVMMIVPFINCTIALAVIGRISLRIIVLALQRFKWFRKRHCRVNNEQTFSTTGGAINLARQPQCRIDHDQQQLNVPNRQKSLAVNIFGGRKPSQTVQKIVSFILQLIR